MLHILYLVNYYTYSHKMSRVRFHAIEEIAKLSNLLYSGPKWPNYNNKLSVQQNIDIIEKQNNIKFNLVICLEPYKNFIDFDKINRPKCIRYDEMYETDKIVSEILLFKPDIVICHYKQYVSKFTNLLKHKVNTVFFHIPHSAKSTIFKPYPEIEKTIDFLLCGYIDKKLYPLRYRFKNSIFPILQNMGYKCEILKHNGYRIKNAHKDIESIRFAKEINKATICLSCASKYKYRLLKYAEIPMSGSILCSDLPDQDKDELSKYIIVVDNDMTDQEIVDKLIKYISDPNKLANMRTLGLEFSKKYTQQMYAKRFIEIIDTKYSL